MQQFSDLHNSQQFDVYLVAIANCENLKTVALDCREDIHQIAGDIKGCYFLKRLFARLDELKLVYEIQSIFDTFVVVPDRLVSFLCRSEFGYQF